MTARRVEGEYVHRPSQTTLRYVCTYEFKPIGVVYETHAAEVGSDKWARIELGVSMWGFFALFPKKKLIRGVHEAIDMLDIEKFRAAVNEA